MISVSLFHSSNHSLKPSFNGYRYRVDFFHITINSPSISLRVPAFDNLSQILLGGKRIIPLFITFELGFFFLVFSLNDFLNAIVTINDASLILI